MERKTKITSEDGKQDLLITREFDLPVELLFTAYIEAEIVEQWMGTKVLKLENRKYGSWEFQTSDPQGNVVVQMSGVIHDIVPNEKITRTFEIANAPFGVQLEFLEFEKLSEERSALNIHTVFRSAAHRDQLLRLPFSHGLNMAFDRLQETLSKLK